MNDGPDEYGDEDAWGLAHPPQVKTMKFRPRARSRFMEIVNELSERNAWRLISMVRNSPGVAPRLRRPWRERMIVKLQDLVEAAHRRHPKKWVRKHSDRQQVTFRKRIEKNDKAVHVQDRLARDWNPRHPVAYVSFKSGGKCLKVGRSDNGLSRIASQAFNYYFRDARRVVVYFPRRSKKKILPALECALTHLYQPFHLYGSWPAETRFLSKCQTCRDMKAVKKIVRERFPL